ncbi:endonuclease/exonuclease/phosphatase family protein [Mangrovimonas sp. YM274]|uniref:endonuclease/exonuclease/phosphatase family protein n=1 Tax=Mangrovimonas sp. YM274 TaxID=3070660 RepID=UPI0027DE922E|nr:endonuclease/exonuclease/phosphatase family protein [Mangrovimonas sp. YM274]WMI68153.1 hypothetical protein RBH95_13490 [Mangrovimonas sp. YM274]
MKTTMKHIYIITVVLISIFGMSCSEGDWKDYTPPTEVIIDDEDIEDEEIDEVTLKVMSFGIYNQHADLNQVAALISNYDPDLVVLREIDHYNARTGIEIEQGLTVANALGMNYYFASGRSYQQGEYGPSMLSKFPIVNPQSTVLPVGPIYGGVEKPFAWAEIEIADNVTIGFASATLDDGSNANRNAENQPLQAQKILDLFTGYEYPLIIGGNFYSQTDTDPHLQMLYQEFTPGCSNCELTYPGSSPQYVADHIIYRTMPGYEMEVLSYEVGNEVINERKPVISEIKLTIVE